MPTFALTLALSACASIEHQAKPVSCGVAPNVADADTTVEHTHYVWPTDPQPELKLSAFNYSYHPQQHASRVDNTAHTGLGINYNPYRDARAASGFESGFFKDSRRNRADLAETIYPFRLGKRWRLSADLPVTQSPTYHNDNRFVVPIPRLTYDFGNVKLSTIYIPRIQDHELIAVFGINLTIPL